MKNLTILKKYSLTFRMLYYWTKLIGINPFDVSSKNDLSVSYLSVIYGCTFLSAYTYVFCRVWNERSKITIPGETPISMIVNFFLLTIGYLEIIATWFIYGFHKNRINAIVKSFTRVKVIAQQLDISDDYQKSFRKLGIYVTIVNIAFLSVVLVTNAAMFGYSNFDQVLWSCYNVPKLTVFNSGIIFLWCFVTVKEQFHRLNDRLRWIVRDNERLKIDRSHVEVAAGLTKKFGLYPICLSDRITIVCQLHRELRHLIRIIKDGYALLMLIDIIVLLATITFNFYVVSRFLVTYSFLSGWEYAYFLVIMYWTVSPIILLAIISNVCASTVNEANEAGNILHAMINDYKNSDDARESAQLNAFSLELLQNRVRLSVFGILDLDNTLVYRILITSTTYLTIMLQLYS